MHCIQDMGLTLIASACSPSMHRGVCEKDSITPFTISTNIDTALIARIAGRCLLPKRRIIRWEQTCTSRPACWHNKLRRTMHCDSNCNLRVQYATLRKTLACPIQNLTLSTAIRIHPKNITCMQVSYQRYPSRCKVRVIEFPKQGASKYWCNLQHLVPVWHVCAEKVRVTHFFWVMLSLLFYF